MKIKLTQSFLVGPGDYCLSKGTILEAEVDELNYAEFLYGEILWLLGPEQYELVKEN